MGVFRQSLVEWVYEAVKSHGGKASLVQVAKHLWEHHEKELRSNERLFYTWQYEMRWAAQQLRNSGRFAPIGTRGYWEVA